MTIFDGEKLLSFNVIGYENDKNDDDYDWLMFRFEYSDGCNIEEFFDPSMTASKLISLKNNMNEILCGEINSLISQCFNDPAFRIAIIKTNDDYEVDVHVQINVRGGLIQRYQVREIMTRERFESIISEITEDTNKFPCRH